MTIVECVECLYCKKLHRRTEPTYVMISGNVYLGHEKPLLDGNLEDGLLRNQAIVCHETKCINRLFFPGQAVTRGFEDSTSYANPCNR